MKKTKLLFKFLLFTWMKKWWQMWSTEKIEKWNTERCCRTLTFYISVQIVTQQIGTWKDSLTTIEMCECMITGVRVILALCVRHSHANHTFQQCQQQSTMRARPVCTFQSFTLRIEWVGKGWISRATLLLHAANLPPTKSLQHHTPQIWGWK